MNESRPNPIDPATLMAFIHDELDATQRQLVQDAVADDPALQETLRRLTALSEATLEVFADDPPAQLEPHRRAALLAAANELDSGAHHLSTSHPRPVGRMRLHQVLAAAAAIGVIAVGALLLMPQVNSPSESKRLVMNGPDHSASSESQGRPVEGALAERTAGSAGQTRSKATEGPPPSPPATIALSGPAGSNGQAIRLGREPAGIAVTTHGTGLMPLDDPRYSLPQLGGGGLRGRARRSVVNALATPGQAAYFEADREGYDDQRDNPFQLVENQPRSTFSADVDTASYANVRRFISGEGHWPPASAVRIEELINYFTYDYDPPAPDSEVPFSTTIDAGPCPWAIDHRLVRIGLQGRSLIDEDRAATNLVFLLDVSGSMASALKLPLLKRAMKLLVDRLGPDDRVAIVVYAGSSGLVLPSTYVDDRGRPAIMDALDRLRSGGSTNGAGGIQQAYAVAEATFIDGGVNRVLLCTDGDFNVGTSSDGELRRLIEEKRQTGVSLSVLGLGRGNLQDHKMETLADAGNGNYAYLDSIAEARKVLVEEMGSTLVTIAKDVKLQVEFNPAKVAAYRLIGYENRMLATEDFNNDAVDAGEIGAGHSVTALYEIIPLGVADTTGVVDPLKYQQPSTPLESDELLTLKLRWKQPGGVESTKIEIPFVDPGNAQVSEDFNFATGVAALGMILRASPHKGNATLAMVQELIAASPDANDGSPASGYREGFRRLVEQAAACPEAGTTGPASNEMRE